MSNNNEVIDQALTPEKITKLKKLIYAVSVIVPIAVAALFGIHIDGVDLSILPPIYATINGVTAFVLILALIAIKRKNMNLHRSLIRVGLSLSIVFLLCYIAYHITSTPVPYGGDYGFIYYPMLIGHIIISVAIIPIVLLTYLWAWIGDYQKHKRWTRFAWPLWFFVAVSGVVVYLMISPYYT